MGKTKEKEENKVGISKLHLMALQLSNSLTDDEEIRKQDVTDLYYDEKEKMIAAGELINVQINGLPGSGKSTAMIAEVFDTNIILKKKTTINHILPNQIVYAQVMKQITEQMFCCIGIDEYDELGETGYNATTDKAALNHYSDLHRDNYLHKYACSPQDTMDKNAFLILEVLGADKKKKFTRCLLNYKLFKSGSEIVQPIGYVDIDVSTVLGTKFYKEYYKRKQHRLKLFSKYGIVHERHIFTGKLILEAVKDLKTLAKYSQLTKDHCRLKVEIVARQLKIINSILTLERTAADLFALLNYVKEQQRIIHTIKKLKQHVGKEDGQHKETLEAIGELQTHLTLLCEEEEKALDYWRKASELEPLYISTLGKVET